MPRPLPCLLVASLLAPATAQEVEKVVLKPPPQAVPARALPGQGFVLEAGELTIEELVDAAARFLNRNILLTPSEVQAAPPGGPPRGGGKADVPPIRLQNRVELDATGCEEMLTSLLQARGFALTPLDVQRNLWDVVAIAGPRQREIINRALTMTPEEVLRRPALKIAVTTTIELKHANANYVGNALRQQFGQGFPHQGVTIHNTGNATSILLVGFADQVGAAIRTIRDCDLPPRPDQPPELAVRVQQHDQQIQALQQQLAKKADKPEPPQK